MKLPEVSLKRIENTYSEAFDGMYCRILVTAERGLTEEDRNGPFIEFDPLRSAAYRATSTPSTVVGRIEAGIEKWLPKEQTPDNREGVVLQFWGMLDKKKPSEEQTERFFKEVAIKVRQDILSASGGTTRAFNYMMPHKAEHLIDSEERVGKCGDDYETFSQEHGEEVISVPLMIGYDFKIDRKIGVGLGISGANFWILCDSLKAGRRAGYAAIRAIKNVDGVITPFYVCPSGSAAKDHPPIGPPTNIDFCPTLRDVVPNSKVPEGVSSIPEIVIDGVDMPSVKNAMREGISAALNVEGVNMISAGNYEGKLGEHKIYLRELFA